MVISEEKLKVLFNFINGANEFELLCKCTSMTSRQRSGPLIQCACIKLDHNQEAEMLFNNNFLEGRNTHNKWTMLIFLVTVLVDIQLLKRGTVLMKRKQSYAVQDVVRLHQQEQSTDSYIE